MEAEAAPRASIEVDRAESGALCLRIHGHLDAQSTAAIWSEATAALAEARPETLILDGSGVEYADGAGVGLLVELRRKQRSRGGIVEMPVMFAIGLWFVMQVTRGLLQFEGVGTQVAYITHISGFAWGMLVAFVSGQFGHGRVEALLQKGERYMREGQPYAAQGVLIRYLARCPDHAIVYARLARAMVLTGNTDGARKNYRLACEMLIDQGHRGECEDAYGQAVRGFPRFRLSAGHQLNLAFGLERNLKPKLAITAYETFEDCYPTNKDASFALLRSAVLYMHSMSEVEKAEECYRRLIERYPENQWVDFAHEQIRCMTVRTSHR